MFIRTSQLLLYGEKQDTGAESWIFYNIEHTFYSTTVLYILKSVMKSHSEVRTQWYSIERPAVLPNVRATIVVSSIWREALQQCCQFKIIQCRLCNLLHGGCVTQPPCCKLHNLHCIISNNFNTYQIYTQLVHNLASVAK